MANFPKENTAWQESFLDGMARQAEILDLFDSLPGVCMYIKDMESRFVKVNRVLSDLVGAQHPTELIGRTDFDYFPPAIAAQYVAEDQRVREFGALKDQIWMVPDNKGWPRMYFCSKIPLHDQSHEIIGVAGIKRPFEYSTSESAGYGRLVDVMAFVSRNYSRRISVTEMARHVNLSASQLQREFSKHFGITPVSYLREVRIGVARHLLESSDLGMAKVAGDCGFFDQSHFTRHFKSTTGLTPLKYRLRFRNREA